MKYILESTGEEVEVPDDPQEQELARAAGLVPAARVEAGKGTRLQAGAEGAERVVGGIAEGIQRATGFGTAPGLDQDAQGQPLPGGGLTSLQDAYSPEARLRREAHPYAAGIGTGLAAAPAAGLAAAGGALLAPGAIPLIGGTVGGVVTEAGVQAAAQEYDDAWLEQRPMELQQVAAKTLMFAGADMLFRGAFAGGKRLLLGAAPETGGLGRNLVSEAQGVARESSPYAKPGASVGAAHAEDLSEPFDDAISSMSDKDAAVLARDSEDHLHLVSQHASEEFTRVNQGLTDNLGTKLKYENFAKNAADWDAPLLERQAGWLDSVVEQGDGVAREVASFAEGKPEAIDFGNLGKKAAKVIDDYNRRIVQETDPARRNLLTDNVKKQLDSVTMSIDASHGVDAVTRGDLKALIAPYREELRMGLQNPKFWGKNANVQRDLNAPWHQFLEHWPKVQQQVLEATGHTAFDTAGAGRVTRESTVDRMLSLLGKDPRSNQEFGKHLAGALDGLNGLIEASQKHGITDNSALEAMAGDVRNLMEDWNLGTTVGVAKNRVAIMQRDPRKWARLALDFGERLPLGVGKTIETVRHLGSAMNDLHLQQDTPLAAVWDRAYQRFAQNPALKDPSIARNYADWVVDSLNKRGGAIPPPAGAMGAPSSAAMNDVMTGSPGFGQAAQSIFSKGAEGDALATVPAGLRERVGAGGIRTVEQARELLTGNQVSTGTLDRTGSLGVAGASKGGLLPKPVAEQGLVPRVVGSDTEAFRKFPIPDRDIFTPHVGTLAEDGIYHERLSGPGGKTPGGFFRGADGKIRYIKSDKDVAHSAIEAGNSSMYTALGRKVPEMRVVKLPGGHSALASEAFGPEWKELNDIPDWGALPKSVRDSYAEGVPTDFIMGNWDVSRNSKNIMTDGTSTLMVDPGEAATNAWAAKWFAGNEKHIEREIGRTTAAGHGNIPSTEEGFLLDPKWGAYVGKEPTHTLLGSYAQSEGELRKLMGRSFERSVATIEQAGGPEAFIRAHQPTLGEAEVKRAAAEMTDRIAKFKTALPFFAAAAYLAFGGTAEAAERPPPPQMPPQAAYREAMQDIAKGGDAHLTALATSALRKRAPGGKGKSPLELFAGSRSIEDAVEQTRQALGRDPSELVKMLGGAVGDLWKTHPGVYGAVVQKAHQIGAYLQQNWPQPTATTLLDPRGGKLSFDRAWDSAAKFVGAAMPKTALREVARGTAAPEMIASVKENWPELWEPFRAEMLGQIQRRAAAGRHIPSERLRRLDQTLGMDGQLDPSASLAVAAHFLTAQDAEAQKRQQAGQSSGSKALSNPSASGMRTRLDAINSERQP
jgi:hypothetical protein